MKAQLSKNTNSPKDQIPADTLAKWLSAVADFKQRYKQVIGLLDIHNHNQNISLTNVECIGQCPISQVTGLLNKMQEELEKLLMDLSQASQMDRLVRKNKYKKLAAHTQAIEELNHEAENVFLLASLSAS
ncbi:hypothetical protein [Spirosoma sp. KNUC1025]|uniref:hypothetical protein n=1 Tax=Spirosoma sp. KNUC1025 TaxID=2894082 RepID=UPI00386E11C7|nr:hypothetical protein LN737_09535 [Spirosoma sp. KNUC1025]